MSYSQIIKEERIKRNLTQQGLAKKIGVSQSTIAMIEDGKRGASDEVKIKLAEYFNLSVEYIFFNQSYYK